jgi:hypothetical protein
MDFVTHHRQNRLEKLTLTETLFVFFYLKYIFFTQQLFMGERERDVSNRCRRENRKTYFMPDLPFRESSVFRDN